MSVLFCIISFLTNSLISDEYYSNLIVFCHYLDGMSEAVDVSSDFVMKTVPSLLP